MFAAATLDSVSARHYPRIPILGVHMVAGADRAPIPTLRHQILSSRIHVGRFHHHFTQSPHRFQLQLGRLLHQSYCDWDFSGKIKIKFSLETVDVLVYKYTWSIISLVLVTNHKSISFKNHFLVSLLLG